MMVPSTSVPYKFPTTRQIRKIVRQVIRDNGICPAYRDDGRGYQTWTDKVIGYHGEGSDARVVVHRFVDQEDASFVVDEVSRRLRKETWSDGKTKIGRFILCFGSDAGGYSRFYVRMAK